ncbi:MAG: CoA transferase, partial [Dehalococcoidales bacterium]|nr:CoA transferase [Dehalococcoidales bacterium]
SLVEAIGQPELAVDPRFNSRENRFHNKDALYEILEKVFLTRTGEEWLELLEKRIPIGPINTVDKALSDPQVLSRNMVVEIDYKGDKKLKILGNPIKMSDIEQEVFTAPPGLGENTEEILSGLLHYSPEEIAELRQQGVI